MNYSRHIVYASRSSDIIVQRLLRESDETFMPFPDIEQNPHLLISKVRKHYLEYLINLLSVNFEKNQNVLFGTKNCHLPSAIWRCAKLIEMNAAQTCMVVQLYRENVMAIIKELKNDTNNGKLNWKLFECLQKPYKNDKKTQTTSLYSKSCDCPSTKRKKMYKDDNKIYHSKIVQTEQINPEQEPKRKCNQVLFKIPVVANLKAHSPTVTSGDVEHSNSLCVPDEISQCIPESHVSNNNVESCIQNQPLQQEIVKISPLIMPKKQTGPLESYAPDEIMLELEKMFRDDSQEEHPFDILYEGLETSQPNVFQKSDGQLNENNKPEEKSEVMHQANMLDESITLISDNSKTNNNNTIDNAIKINEVPKSINKNKTSKWICEEYFQKLQLFELLDKIGDTNRKKRERIKEVFLQLFGDDSDDEAVMSPLEETPEFVFSCKERIAPWVVKLLTPSYNKGQIRGKALFKALAKHLIRLIYQCSRYPQEYEVTSFVSDFLTTHKLIRCEADFKAFKIDNI